MKLRTVSWLFVLLFVALVPTQFLGQGGPYYGKVFDEGGAVYNVLGNNFGYVLVCDDSTNDRVALQNLVTAVSAAGGGVIQFSPTNHYCVIDGATLRIPINIHLRGCGPGTNGSQTGTKVKPACGLDLRYSSTEKMVWDDSMYYGAGSIVDMAIVDTKASDCGPLVTIGKTTMWIERTLFQGSQSGTSACNDAILLGDDNYGFGGYKTRIIDNEFDNIRRAVVEGKNANGVVVSGNRVRQTSGNIVGGAFEASAATGSVYGGVFANNGIEMTNYKYGIYLGENASGFNLYGNNCDDAVVANAGSCYLYDVGATNNFGLLMHYDASSEKGAVDNNPTNTFNTNQTLDPNNGHNGNFAHIAYNTCWGTPPGDGNISVKCENAVTATSIPNSPPPTPLTMATPQYNTRYRFSFTASLAALGVSCGGSSDPSLKVTLYYTDHDSNKAMASPVVGVQGNMFSGVLASWDIPRTAADGSQYAFRSFPMEFSVDGNTSVGFRADLTSACATNPKYAFYPHLEQLP